MRHNNLNRAKPLQYLVQYMRQSEVSCFIRLSKSTGAGGLTGGLSETEALGSAARPLDAALTAGGEGLVSCWREGKLEALPLLLGLPAHTGKRQIGNMV